MQTTVPVGPTTIAGISGALTAFALAIVAFIDGDRSEETIGALITGAVLLATVLWGRYRQATEQIAATAGSDELDTELLDGPDAPEPVKVTDDPGVIDDEGPRDGPPVQPSQVTP